MHDIIAHRAVNAYVTGLARVFWKDGVLRVHYKLLVSYLVTEFAAEIQDIRRHYEIDNEVRTSSFLTRDDEGNYGFGHKSYAEYFIAKLFANSLNTCMIDSFEESKRITSEIIWFPKDLIDFETVEELLESTLTTSYKPNITENALVLLYGLRKQSIFRNRPGITSRSYPAWGMAR